MFSTRKMITEEESEPAVCGIAFFVCGGLEGRNPEGTRETWVRLRTRVSRKAVLPTK
jgi:hypothetical protein